MRSLPRLALAVCVLALTVTAPLLAQRELSWDELSVTARLDADGVLDVAERQTMIFTGDWNGGERVFNLRPRQKLEFLGMDRLDATGTPQALRETSGVPNNVDEFVLTDARTLRWRSRLPSDPPFANARLTYVLHYKLSGILLKDAEQYQLDHDFAFPDRVGPIARFSLDLALDPAWQPLSEVREHYTAGPLAPGRSFVLTLPLRYTGTGSPSALDTRRPPEIVQAVAAILGVFALGVGVFFVREHGLGRFAPLSTSGVDATWIEQNIVAQPAEVVGAAWDGNIGAPEVVALIARMTGEGKLASKASDSSSMTLRLMVDRNTLEGHERALVDGLFFDGRTETSTAAVQQHYKSKGFDPSQAISTDLNSRVREVMPGADARISWVPTVVLLLAGAGLLGWTAYTEADQRSGPFVMLFVLVFGSILLQIPGWLFRARMDRGVVAAALSMIPAFLVSAGAAAFLWFIVGSGRVELPWTMIAGIAAWVMCISNASINGLKSRQTSESIAFRKRLTAGRRFFETELEKPHPALRDNWYPWLLAFGLGKEVDSWSTRNESAPTRSSAWDRSTSSSSSGSSSSSSTDNSAWTGGGGRSGGAGGGATWAAAAAGMAAGVSAPSSSSSGGGGSSSSSSSGGGGGGGW
jgi:uncharacterized membrane protein YgcG